MVGFQLEFIVKLSHSFMLSYQVGAGIVIGLYFSTYILTSWNWFPISPKKLTLAHYLQILLLICVLLYLLSMLNSALLNLLDSVN